MAEKKEEKIEKEAKKSNSLLITCLVIVLMGVCSVGGFLIGSTKIVTKYNDNLEKSIKESKTEKETTKEETTEKETVKEETKETTTTQDTTNCNEEKVVETAKPRCYGTYKLGGAEEKWILKEDGTWQVEGQEKFGVYYITKDTITFVEMKHTNGPESASYHSPNSYYISEDCNNIRFTESGSHTSAGLTKVQ